MNGSGMKGSGMKGSGMRGWVGLVALGLLVVLEISLIERLAAQHSAAVLLAAWEPGLVLEFGGTLALRILVFLGLPPALVLLLAGRLSTD